MRKRIASILLVALMLLSLLPVPAWAAEVTEEVSVGDINGTDGIDITDVNCLYEYLITGEQDGSLSEKQFQAAADLNKDGQINIYDLQLLYEVANGLLSINDLPGNDKNKVKIGIITYLDENSSTDLYFINGIKEAIASLGLSEIDYVVKTQVSQEQVYDTAVALVDAGCNIIFANNFWYELYLIQAAKEFPSVQFSAIPPVPVPIPRGWQTTTTLLPPSTRAAI